MVAAMLDFITLVAKTVTIDAYGDKAVQEKRRQVFCMVESIGMREFYQAHAVGLQPEIKFVIADYLDYQNELTVEYSNPPVSYRVLRNFRKGQELELFCTTEVVL